MTSPSTDTTAAVERALADPERLAAIQSLGLGLAEDAFDRASRLASRALGAAVGLVSIVTDDRQIFTGRYGLGEPWATTRQTPLSHSFCQLVVVTGRPVAVENAPEDERVRDNLAIRDLDVVAYLGVPLFGPAREVLGSFCVIEPAPRAWTDEDLEVLSDAAMAVQRELDLRATIRDLNEARRERDNLLQAMAHDIRSPLTTVIAGAKILGRPDLGPERRTEFGGQEQPADDVVRAVVTARTIAGHGPRLHTDLADGTSVTLPGEPFASIVTNLVDNALSHTDGAVRISLQRDHDTLVLVVDDDGPGYDVEAVASGRQAARGYGLGRAIVGHHVQDLGGTRDVRSHPDTGTTVTVRLPVGG